MARLLINPNSPEAKEIELKPGTNLVGRGEQNDFTILDGTVSTTHCEITVGDAVVHLRDLGSTNGTFIDGTPVLEADLTSGQVVRLGELEMVFLADPAVARSKPAPLRVTMSGPVRAQMPAVPEPAAPAPTASPGRSSAPVRLQGLPVPGSAVAVPPPPMAAAPVTPAVQSGPQPCKHHPKTLGRFACDHCQHAFCDLCVTTRNVGGVPKRFCRHCGSECLALAPQPYAHTRPKKSFFSQLPGAFVYPFRGSGLLVLVFATILFACLDWFTGGKAYGFMPRVIGWGMLLWVFATGYMFSYMQNIIQATATEEQEMPPLPSMADFWGDMLLPCLQLIGLTLICFGPAIGVMIYALATSESSLAIAVIGLALLGCIYFPMAFLAVAVLDSVMAANPLQVVPSIFRVPGQYIITVFLLAFVFGLRSLGDFVMPILFPKGLTTHSMAELVAFIGASAFWSLAGIYLLTVNMRILGLLYVTNKERLGWLTR